MGLRTITIPQSFVPARLQFQSEVHGGGGGGGGGEGGGGPVGFPDVYACITRLPAGVKCVCVKEFKEKAARSGGGRESEREYKIVHM